MNTLFLVILFEYIGIPEDAAKILAFMIYFFVCFLIIGALISIINIGTYTKKTNEQNDIIIKQLYKQKLQNEKIIQHLRTITSNNTEQNTEQQNNNTNDFRNEINGFQNYYNDNTLYNDHM